MSPRAVEQADGLVASAMKRLAESFAEERSRLESSGIGAIVFPQKISALLCNAIGRFFSVCSPFNERGERSV